MIKEIFTSSRIHIYIVEQRSLISVSQSASQSVSFSPLRVIKSIFPLLEGTRFGNSKKGRAKIRRVIQFYYFSVSAGTIRDILHLLWIIFMKFVAIEGKYFHTSSVYYFYSL